MTYKQALALKKAGFPQKFKPFLSLDNGRKKDKQNSITYSTLEEIISELGDKFEFLRAMPDMRWDAQASQLEPEKIWNSGFHKTPLEALINLYIKINEK
jgi:hypothetical protein